MIKVHDSVTCRRGTAVIVAAWLICSGLIAFAQTKNSCLDCHSNLPEPLGVSVETYSQNMHAQKGLTCAACHGGDANSDDPEKAMSRKSGWKGKIERKQIPELCASCHSDAERMKKYNPSLRVDQFQQYKTSVHGMKWAKGDNKVAVCTDCHGVHDLRAPSDPRSTVHPTNIAKTCSRCHADAEYMKPYGIKTDQFANYEQSVHHDAMVVRGDLSAPTCTTCHGNHGATPPGVANVTNVCSNCHVFQAQLFETSPHKDAFAAMGFPGCVTCHSNHAIKHPTDEMIGTRPESRVHELSYRRRCRRQQAEAMHTQLTNLAVGDCRLGGATRPSRTAGHGSQPAQAAGGTGARCAVEGTSHGARFPRQRVEAGHRCRTGSDETDLRCWGEGDAGMEVPACRAGAIAGDDRPHAGGTGVLYQELGTEVRRSTLRFINPASS